MQELPISNTRRRFLKLGLATGGVVLAAGAGFSWFAQSPAPAGIPVKTAFGTLLVLSPEQAEIYHAFAETILPQGNGFPSALEAEVIQRLDEELYFISSSIADDFKMVIDVLEYLPIVYGYFSRFSKLSVEKRLEFLRKTEETDSDTVRAVIGNARIVCYNMYYGHESSWAAIGYDGPFGNVPEQLSEQRKHYAALIKESHNA